MREAFLKKWQLGLGRPPRRNITSKYPCAAVILAFTSSGFLPVRTSCWKKLFFGDFIMKNHKLYVNLTILAGFFAITRSKIIASTFRKMEKTRIDEFYIYVVKIFLLKLIFRKLYSKKLKKMPKIAYFVHFEPSCSLKDSFAWHPVFGY